MVHIQASTHSPAYNSTFGGGGQGHTSRQLWGWVQMRNSERLGKDVFPLAVPCTFVGRKVMPLGLTFFLFFKYKSLIAGGMAQRLKVPVAKSDRWPEPAPWGPRGGERMDSLGLFSNLVFTLASALTHRHR